jgi:hypothetical protein
MKKTSTLSQLTYFTQQEKQLTKELFSGEIQEPKNSTIQSLLNFSKSLSVRKTSSIGNIEFVLS